ncbi:Planctomycete cytochrome C [Rubinisphaera italica]|uniref:Planctomycete cytochrome C n=1 Tax=Rubinisphaera italica TaxID=2527969 RepID=A0A5C5XE99_9PLAN|nr:Planctomycete cytochrome C [Rubinisphaera italica]
MTDRSILRAIWIVLLLLCPTVAWGASGQVERVNYSRDIRPILAGKCFVCHGPDEGSREAGLRLDLATAALEPADSGMAAIIPGDSEHSELIARVNSTDEYEQMPPSETGKSLSEEEKSLLKAWIDQGAEYTAHWSFRSVGSVELPDAYESAQPQHPIDVFVKTRLERDDLTMSPPADRAVLIRRLYLDLVGLPPTYAEVQDFVADESPGAVERLVDELLASPHFGERWGRHWLDLARYADSNGYLGDELRPQAYRYRDWVIDAINRDLPYDRFTIEQIAGDLLENSTISQKIATGFHANAMVNTEAGVDREADRVIQTVDRLSTVGTAWLGLTIGCAECHTHKYDPITHAEFYQMYAFFNGLEADRQVIKTLPAPVEDPQKKADRLAKMEELATRLKSTLTENTSGEEQILEQALKILAIHRSDRTETQKESLDHWRDDLDKQSREWTNEYEKLAQKQPKPVDVVALSIRERSQPRDTFIHHRGDFRQPGPQVEPGTPAFLPPLQPRGERADRLDLARWLVRADNPLTARTAVNHIWQHLFGQGLVDTEDNFGTTGSEPSHPELLDWLATSLIEEGWSRKKLIRLIVTSQTYQQSSAFRTDLHEVDAQNRLLGRQSRFRVEAEIVRDLALSVADLLYPKIGGPSIKPPLNSRITQVSRNQEWKVSAGADKYRRGMYIQFRRATPYPMLTTFDAPATTSSCPERERSNSPLQALAMLNDSVFWECAQQLGLRTAALGDVALQEWLTYAVRTALSRDPSSEELARLETLTAEFESLTLELSDDQIDQLLKLESDGKSVSQDAPSPTSTNAANLSPRQQVVRILICRSLINLEQFITRE